MNRTLNSGCKVIYRFKISFFVFDIIEFECEFDYSIFSEISPIVEKSIVNRQTARSSVYIIGFKKGLCGIIRLL